MSVLAIEDSDIAGRPVYRRLGVINGLLIGIALALGLWGLDLIRLARVPVRLEWAGIIVAALLIIVIAGAAGWLASRTDRVTRILPIWLLAAVAISYTVSYRPTWGRTLLVWLVDRRFWGLPLYPADSGPDAAPLLAGFFIALILAILALLQPYRLEAISSETSADGRLLSTAWRLLLLPLTLVLAAGYITTNSIGDPAADGVDIVHQAIERTREYRGDLYELSLVEGLNYNALRGVRDRLDGGYVLLVGSTNAADATTIIAAHFDSGFWLHCRMIGDYLSFCFDASPPYTTGLAALLAGDEPPEPCPGCLPTVAEQWRLWLRDQGRRLGDEPVIRRVAQWGGSVVMRAEGNGSAVECRFQGLAPVTLERCEAVTP